MRYRNINKSELSANFSKVTISLASPEMIREWSYGEVKKPETINYRTHKPEMDGLFCERIFGPVKDYECHCGKYKRVRYKGIVCDKCGVEVTEKRVRRKRMGHIELQVPVVHTWYIRSRPGKIAMLLNLKAKELEEIIYYEKYIVLNPGPFTENELVKGQLIEIEVYDEIMEKLGPMQKNLDDDDPRKFVAYTGGLAIETMLKKLDLDALAKSLREELVELTSKTKKEALLKRLKIVEAFRTANKTKDNRPERMVVRIVPVIPPDLRPLVPLEGGRFATSDLNELYRRLINRNNRLRKFLEMKVPAMIIRHEMRMLQEAVDALFDNSKKSNTMRSGNNRALKSLSDIIKGKSGRFRQNLLGKRVDYSGRSVIVVGPELKLHECGVPKDMAAELFKPFIQRRLIERGIAKNPKTAKKLVEEKNEKIWDILEEIMKGHPVLLNRAPTLHRLGIQAFQPKLIEGKAIQLHPLVCAGFNADFDGDQMAIHVPLSNKAILEAMTLMLASHNILHPANGTPITVPSQDMVLGLYYLTKTKPVTDKEKEIRFFASREDALMAYNTGKIELHEIIEVRLPKRETKRIPKKHFGKRKGVKTTAGRLIFNELVPEEVRYVNGTMTKKQIKEVIHQIFKTCGNRRTVLFLDRLKEMGYYYAFKGGLSFRISDVVVPETKKRYIEKARKKVEEITEEYQMGVITESEKYNQVVDIWQNTINKIKKDLMKKLKEDQNGFNPVYMMLHSGARGSEGQINQLGGLRGLMQKPQKHSRGGTGEVIETPILSNFKEGLSVIEYFISTHGARKGLSDTALKTADAGYLTRKLVTVAQDIVVTEKDCGTLRGITVKPLKNEKNEVIKTVGEFALGRVPLEDIVHPKTGKVICKEGELITPEIAEAINKADIDKLRVRSVLTCDAARGVCVKCYGMNVAIGRIVQEGEAVGVMAAQSIGEPGTQLTLRTFHQGGVAAGEETEKSVSVPDNVNKAIVKLEKIRTIKATEEDKDVDIVISRGTKLILLDAENPERIILEKTIPYGAKLYTGDGEIVTKGQLLVEWDPHNTLIIAEKPGIVELQNVIEGITARLDRDETTGLQELVIIESKSKEKGKTNPVLKIVDKAGKELSASNLPKNARLMVKDGDKVSPGTILAKIPRNVAKASDITGGLPKVQGLFEARKPTDAAILAEIDGVVKMGPIKGKKRHLTITTTDGLEVRNYAIPLNLHIIVGENDYVEAGQPLTDGSIDPREILRIKGISAVQEYIIEEVQGVYRGQGVEINNKHLEIIIKQMMQKVQIIDPGDTVFQEKEQVLKSKFMEENAYLFNKKIITDMGDYDKLFKDDSDKLAKGDVISLHRYREINKKLNEAGLQPISVRDAKTAIATPVLQGISTASLSTESWLSAASFQRTTDVLANAAIQAQTDYLVGLKENVIVGHLVPAGTGLKKYRKIEAAHKSEFEEAAQKAQQIAREDSEFEEEYIEE